MVCENDPNSHSYASYAADAMPVESKTPETKLNPTVEIIARCLKERKYPTGAHPFRMAVSVGSRLFGLIASLK